jgi:hypothetical protein
LTLVLTTKAFVFYSFVFLLAVLRWGEAALATVIKLDFVLPGGFATTPGYGGIGMISLLVYLFFYWFLNGFAALGLFCCVLLVMWRNWRILADFAGFFG